MDHGVKLAGILVAVTVVVQTAHGIPHVLVPVTIETWQTAFVVLVAYASIIGGWILLWRGASLLGPIVLVTSSLATASFDTVFHFIVSSPDHVGNVTGAWHMPFLVTSVMATLAPLAVAGVGLWLLWTDRDVHVGSPTEG